jgi:nucleotide-binding universal stress UspA family protein
LEAARFVNVRETPALAVGPECSEIAREPGSTGAVVRFNTILVPTDFSDESGKALRHAMALANAFGAQIVLLHVFKAVRYPGWPNLVLPKDLDKMITRSQRQLDLMCEEACFDSDLEVFRLVHTSDTPAEEIIEAARDLKADIIVIGAHAHAKSKRALPGVTAAHIVGHAPCPVLLVPPSAPDSAPDDERLPECSRNGLG